MWLNTLGVLQSIVSRPGMTETPNLRGLLSYLR